MTMETGGSENVVSAYPLSVDYGRSVEDALKLGCYDQADGDINSLNFPTNREGMADVLLELIPADWDISNDDALLKLDGMGYRGAELHELLAFGEKHPDIQRKFPVPALGSLWRGPDGRLRAPCLSGSGSIRNLYLCRTEFGWGNTCWFAVVRKSG